MRKHRKRTYRKRRPLLTAVFTAAMILSAMYIHTYAKEHYATGPMIALTFDDGPGPYTEELLDCLEENRAQATFFMLGQNVGAYPETVKRMKKLKCEIGNHSWNHPDLTTLSLEDALSQLRETDDALIRACGSASTVVRAPYGSYSSALIEAAGKPFIMWSTDSLDWKLRDAEADYQQIMGDSTLSDGSIILMHDIHKESVECAKRLIPDLIAKGYRLVTVSELAQAKNVTLQAASYTDFWERSLNP